MTPEISILDLDLANSLQRARATPRFHTEAFKLSEQTLGFGLPIDWTGGVEIEGLLADPSGIIHWAEHLDLEPQFYGVYARRADNTVAWLVDVPTEHQANVLADRLAVINAYAIADEHERVVAFARIHEERTRKNPISTDDDRVAAREACKAAELAVEQAKLVGELMKSLKKWSKTSQHHESTLVGERIIVVDSHHRAVSLMTREGKTMIQLKLAQADLNGVTFMTPEAAKRVCDHLIKLWPDSGPFVARDFQDYARQQQTELLAVLDRIQPGLNVSNRLSGEVRITLYDTATAAFFDIGRNAEIKRIFLELAQRVRAGGFGSGFQIHDANGNVVGHIGDRVEESLEVLSGANGRVYVTLDLARNAFQGEAGPDAQIAASIAEAAEKISGADEEGVYLLRAEDGELLGSVCLNRLHPVPEKIAADEMASLVI